MKPSPRAAGFLVLAAACSGAFAGFDRLEVAPPQGAAGDAASGWCEIRLDADDSATLKLDRLEATLSTAKGSACRILSAVCTPGLAEGATDFRISRPAGAGRVELLWPPTSRNGWNATIRLYEARPGDEAYTVRLDWLRTAPEDQAPGQGASGGRDVDRRESSNWKQLSFDGPGRGSWHRAGSSRTGIVSARWEAAGDGRITGSFTLEGDERLEFAGHVASAGRYQMVASIQSTGEISRRGAMTINRGRDGSVKRITIEGVEDNRSFSISFNP